MAIGTGAAILGAGLLGGAGAYYGANSAGDAYDASTAESRRQFDEIQRLLAPQQQLGDDARNRIAVLLGLDPVATSTPYGYQQGVGLNDLRELGLEPGTDIPSHVPPRLEGANDAPSVGGGSDLYAPYTGSPSYQFIQDEQRRQTEAGAAARGGLLSGGATIELADRAADVAALDFNNEINRLLALANGTQAATSSLVDAGLSTSSNISNALIGEGNARASGITGITNTLGNTLNNYSYNSTLQDLLNQFGGGTELPGMFGARFPG